MYSPIGRGGGLGKSITNSGIGSSSSGIFSSLSDDKSGGGTMGSRGDIVLISFFATKFIKNVEMS